MKTVTIDAQAFSWQKRGGISRYFLELLRRRNILESKGVRVDLPVAKVLCNGASMLFPQVYSLPPRLFQRSRILLSTNAVAMRRRNNGEVIHHTYYDPRYLKGSKRIRVSTVHDMIPEKFPHLFPNGNPHWAKREYVEASDIVICVSQNSAEDMQQYYGLDAQRIAIIPLGVGPQFMTSEDDEPLSESKHNRQLLYVGPRGGHKNFDVVLRAMRVLNSETRDLTLLAVGGGEFDVEELHRIHSQGLSGRVRQAAATDSELATLYRESAALVVPSLYEGFGLPIVEAMSSGCPVIAARAGSLPEVSGTAAELFEPEDEEELSHLIVRLLADSAHRSRLIARGRQRSVLFTWDRTAQLTAELYGSL